MKVIRVLCNLNCQEMIRNNEDSVENTVSICFSSEAVSCVEGDI